MLWTGMAHIFVLDGLSNSSNLDNALAIFQILWWLHCMTKIDPPRRAGMGYKEEQVIIKGHDSNLTVYPRSFRPKLLLIHLKTLAELPLI